jgi:hypothetical protein
MIEVGDLVFAYDERTGTTGTYTVTATMAHLDPVIVRLTLDGEQIQTTPEHPFFVDGKWVEAKDLRSSDWIQQIDGTSGQLYAIEIEERPQVMYDLTVAETHTYSVGDKQWLVHNCLWTPGRYGNPVKNAYKHWEKHKAEFPELNNALEYVQATHRFVDQPPPGTLSKTRTNGDVVMYDSASNTFAVKSASGAPATMFRPDPATHNYPTNMDYYNAQ